MKTHKLKTWPEYFERLISGQKNFEIRTNDRDFQVGDRLWLCEYDPEISDFTGESVNMIVTYIFHGGLFGVKKGTCIMSVKPE